MTHFCKWNTACLMFILEVLLESKSKQEKYYGYVCTCCCGRGFKYFVGVSRGFRKKGKLFKLRKTLHHLQNISHGFWKYLTQKLNNCGLVQSNFDPCLFIAEIVICILFVVDSMFWARDEYDFHDLDLALCWERFDIEQEDESSGFLGIKLVHNSEPSHV